MKWVKWLGFSTAVPIGLFAIVLAIAGVRSYSDISRVTENGKAELSRIVESGKRDLPATVESAKRDLSDLQNRAAQLRGEYGKLDADVQKYKLVNDRIAKLQADLSTVQGQIGSWYAAMKMEVFDSNNWSGLRFFPIGDNCRRAIILQGLDATSAQADFCQLKNHSWRIERSAQHYRGKRQRNPISDTQRHI